jgi:hypothetical protein
LFELEKKLYLISINVEGLEISGQSKSNNDDEEDNSDDNYDGLEYDQDQMEIDKKQRMHQDQLLLVSFRQQEVMALVKLLEALRNIEMRGCLKRRTYWVECRRWKREEHCRQRCPRKIRSLPWCLILGVCIKGLI